MTWGGHWLIWDRLAMCCPLLPGPQSTSGLQAVGGLRGGLDWWNPLTEYVQMQCSTSGGRSPCYEPQTNTCTPRLPTHADACRRTPFWHLQVWGFLHADACRRMPTRILTGPPDHLDLGPRGAHRTPCARRADAVRMRRDD